MKKISELITQFIFFINDFIIPLIFAVAILVFLFGVFRYMIAGAAKPEDRKTGAQLIMYSIIGLAIMISVWGIVRLVIGSFNFDSTSRPCLPTFNGDSNCTIDGKPKSSTSGSATFSPSNSSGNPQSILPPGYDQSAGQNDMSDSDFQQSPLPAMY